MNKNKILAFLLVICIVLGLGGCAKNGGNTEGTAAGENGSTLKRFTLLYCTKDTFDPYKCKTEQNFNLANLMYDPLIKIDNNFNPVNVLAETASVNGTLCTVILKNAKFTDGTAVTPDDVVFSFNKAKKSSGAYFYNLKNAASIAVTGEKSLSITLTKADPYFLNVLDFPILKVGSDSLKNSDNKELPPIGAGRYVLNDTLTELTANENYHGGKVNLKKISLIDSPDNESNNSNIEIGAIDYYYSDLQDGTFPKMNGTKATVNLTNIVFLGVNTNAAYLSKVLVRQAISAAINRTVIAENSYFTNATPAIGPFPTAFSYAKDYQTIPTEGNKEAVAKNMASAGYTETDSAGYYLSGKRRISISILVNNDNEVRVAAADKIAEELNSAGIFATVKAVSRAEYDNRIAQKNFDLYLGEMKYSNNMDLTDFCNTVYASGYSPNAKAQNEDGDDNGSSVTLRDAVKRFYEGTMSIGDVITVYTSELPVIPVVFKSGLAVYTSEIKSGLIPSNDDLFFGIEKIN